MLRRSAARDGGAELEQQEDDGGAIPRESGLDLRRRQCARTECGYECPSRFGVTGVMVRRDTRTAQPGPRTVQKPEGLRIIQVGRQGYPHPAPRDARIRDLPHHCLSARTLLNT